MDHGDEEFVRDHADGSSICALRLRQGISANFYLGFAHASTVFSALSGTRLLARRIVVRQRGDEARARVTQSAHSVRQMLTAKGAPHGQFVGAWENTMVMQACNPKIRLGECSIRFAGDDVHRIRVGAKSMELRSLLMDGTKPNSRGVTGDVDGEGPQGLRCSKFAISECPHRQLTNESILGVSRPLRRRLALLGSAGAPAPRCRSASCRSRPALDATARHV
jgi:hypothetical protein